MLKLAFFLIFPTYLYSSEGCGNFLKKLKMEHKSIEFLGCKKESLAQLFAFKARYRVKGTEAKKAEKHLVKNLKMSPLSFQCCGWLNSSVMIDTHKGYFAQMGSPETIEQDWNKISYFDITIIKPIGEP